MARDLKLYIVKINGSRYLSSCAGYFVNDIRWARRYDSIDSARKGIGANKYKLNQDSVGIIEILEANIVTVAVAGTWTPEELWPKKETKSKSTS